MLVQRSSFSVFVIPSRGILLQQRSATVCLTTVMADSSSLDAATESLRKRNTPLRANSKEDARRAVLELNALEEKEAKGENDRKTFGRTPGGTGKNHL